MLPRGRWGLAALAAERLCPVRWHPTLCTHRADLMDHGDGNDAHMHACTCHAPGVDGYLRLVLCWQGSEGRPVLA
jgi:hypothetical protein